MTNDTSVFCILIANTTIVLIIHHNIKTNICNTYYKSKALGAICRTEAMTVRLIIFLPYTITGKGYVYAADQAEA